MKKYLKKIRILIFTALFLCVVSVTKIYGASANITISSATAANGEEVTVSVTINADENIAMADLWLSYDASILEYVSGADGGGGGSIRLLSADNTSFNIKFKAIAAGTSAITVNTGQSSVGSLYTDSLALSATNGSVTVKAPASYSSNNNLSALSISPGTLKPAFSADVTTYNTEVPADCKRLIVSATTADSKAKISIWGAALDPGDNTTKITVTAENGATKVYTIYTKRPVETATQNPTGGDNEKPTEKPADVPKTDVLVNVDGQDYFVLSNFDESVLPEGYEAAEYSYKGTDVIVGKGLSNGLIVFYMESAVESGSEKLFFIYDEAGDKFVKLQRLNSKAREFTILREGMTELPEGYVATKLEFAGEQIDVWVENDASPKYFLFYGMSVDGATGWYRYDLAENTIQNAFKLENGSETGTSGEPESEQSTEAAATVSGDYQKLKSEYDNYAARMKLILGILVVALIAVIVVFVIFVIRSFTRAGESFETVEGTAMNDTDEYDELVFTSKSAGKDRTEKENASEADEDEDVEGDLPDLDDVDISEDFTFIDLDE